MTSKVTSDFDFLQGYFDVKHRQLVKSGSDEWIEHTGTTTARTHFDGAISIDEMRFPDSNSYGLSLRVFDPNTREWSIYWVNSKTYELGPPVRGKWENGSCRLIGKEEHEGQLVVVTYEWSDITETTARWQQQLSFDDGETWEPNWIMEFTRRDTPPPPLDLPKVTGDFDFLVGSWDMRNRRRRPALGEPAEWSEFDSTMKVWSYFDGAISFDEGWFPSLGFQGATFRLYDPETAKWSIYWINSTKGTLTEPPQVGSFTSDGTGIFDSEDTWENQPVTVRYTWTPGTTQSAWEQSFSPDNGETWVPNWTMKHTKTS